MKVIRIKMCGQCPKKYHQLRHSFKQWRCGVNKQTVDLSLLPDWCPLEEGSITAAEADALKPWVCEDCRKATSAKPDECYICCKPRTA